MVLRHFNSKRIEQIFISMEIDSKKIASALLFYLWNQQFQTWVDILFILSLLFIDIMSSMKTEKYLIVEKSLTCVSLYYFLEDRTIEKLPSRFGITSMCHM